MVRAFQRFCHFTSVSSPVAPLFMHLTLPFHSISPHTQRSLIFICTNIFLACSSFLLFLFPAVSLLCYVVFCCFFFRFGLVLLPNTLRKAFHVCCAYEFQIFKNVSIVSLAFVVQVCVGAPCMCVCVCGGRRLAQAKAGGERRNANCEKIAMCAAPLPLSSPSHYPLPLTLIEMIFNGLKRQRT